MYTNVLFFNETVWSKSFEKVTENVNKSAARGSMCQKKFKRSKYFRELRINFDKLNLLAWGKCNKSSVRDSDGFC